MSILQSSESSIKSERPKIPIPRWGKSRADQDISYRGKIERRRVTHACEPCREKKTKCDGGRPMCYHCRVSGIPCHYGDGKRERARKNLRMLESRIVDLEGLIQDIQPHLNNTGKLMVKGVLSRNPAPSLPINDSTERPLSARGNDTTSNYQSPRQHSAGSLSQSFMPEDIGFAIPMSHQIKGVHTEFVISQSECAEKGNDALWIQHGDQGFESDGSNTPAGKTAGLVPSYDTPGTTLDNMRTMDSTQRNTQDIFNGDQEISSRSRQVDTFSLPPKLIAERLIDSYFNTVHPLFPIIYKPHFMTQFNKHYGSSEGLLEPTACQGLRKWLTILNLVFAIAEKYLQSELGTNIGDQGRDTDYFARSRILGALDGGSVFQIPDLGRIQALGLTSMYLLASIQTNRAWNVAGLAIRLAHAIGLHLRGDIISGDLETIMRSRTWYCLYYLETTLCLITGRPCAIQDRNCTAPHPSNLGGEVLPAPYSEAAVLDTYFSKHQTLMAISADMLSALYSEKCFRDKSWPQVQGLIAGLSTKLENWRAQLPLTLDFFREEYNQLFKRQRLNLAFQYHTVLMLINRPCLSKVSSRKDSTPNEPPELGAFNKMASEACISSARAIIHLIVKGYKSRDLVPNSPWWSLIHHLIPAKKVIMLEVTDGGPHLPEYRATLLDDCRMVLTWLRGMSKMNTALQRHSLELSEQLQQIAPEIFDQFGEVVVYGPENVLPQFILSTAQPVSILPQHAEHRGLQFDAYGKACYDTHYRFLDSKNTRVCSSSYQPGRDTMIMAESPISVHSRPTDNPQADNTNLWLDAYI